MQASTPSLDSILPQAKTDLARYIDNDVATYLLGVFKMNYFSTKQVAESYGLSPRTLERWRLEGEGPKYRKIWISRYVCGIRFD